MALVLLFNPRKLPRTMTRAQWREVDRWRRVTSRQLTEQLKQDSDAIRLFCAEGATFGTATLGLREKMIDAVTHPGFLIGPYQLTEPKIDLRPGALNFA